MTANNVVGDGLVLRGQSTQGLQGVRRRVNGVLDERDEGRRRHSIHGCQANAPGSRASDSRQVSHWFDQ